jgi:hypothetical protein
MFGRHLQVSIRITNRFDEKALVGTARDNGRSGISAFAHGLTRIKSQAAFQLLAPGAMTFVTPFHQHRPDLLLKEFDSLGVGSLGSPDDSEVAAAKEAAQQDDSCSPGAPSK